MRYVLTAGLGALALVLGTPGARAQRGYFNRTTVNRTPATRGLADDFTPYRGSAPAGRGDYRRAPAEAAIRREPPPAPAARRNYFPGLPAGQGPNRNYVDPSRLCVPGRRAFIYGR